MAFKYARVGPPFNFLGHHTESQKNAFKDWVNTRAPKLAQVQVSNQIRAQQLRKTAGVLEKFYQTHSDEVLAPTFEKPVWKPGADGHFVYAAQNDHVPMVVMTRIKAKLQPQLERHDEAVFEMNRIRNLIERYEDHAQKAKDAPSELTDLFSQLETLFSQPQYEAVLVKDVDQSNWYEGSPRYRVHALDEPTPWEKFINNHGGPIQLKEKQST